LMMEVAK